MAKWSEAELSDWERRRKALGELMAGTDKSREFWDRQLAPPKATGAEKPHKYGRSDREGRTYNGVIYDSKREARHAAELDVLMRFGRILKLERQIPYDLCVNKIKICKIVVDFRVTYHTGRVVLEEVKGFETPEWKLKRKLFAALYPDLEYEVIK